jgi:ABC-type multidrug transport system ATPase subunit
MNTMALIIEANGLRRSFTDREAIVEVIFSVHRGEILGLLGPNGAVKTTAIAC